MRTKIMMSMLSIALIAALIGGATLAWFSDEASTDAITMAAGTLMVDLDQSAMSEIEILAMKNLNPGDEKTWDLTVKNSGSKQFQWGLYAFWQDTIGADREDIDFDGRDFGTGKLSDVVKFDILVDGAPYASNAVLGTFPADPVDNPLRHEEWSVDPEAGYLWTFATENGEAIILPAGDDVIINIVATFPQEAGNEYQGSQLELAFGVLAAQSTNGAPGPIFDPAINPFAEEPQL